MKNKIIVKIVLIIAVISFSFSIQIPQASDNTVGVEIGQKANYKVLKNQFVSDIDRSFFRYVLTYENISDIQVTNEFNIRTIIEVVNSTMSTYEGDIFEATVIELPSNTTNNATLQFYYNNQTWDMMTGFLLGTPIITTDWASWGQFIELLPSLTNDNHTIITTKSEDSIKFNSTIKLSFTNLPENITFDGAEKMTFGLTTSYNKSNGILLYESATIEILTPIQRTLTQYFTIQYTNDSPTTIHVDQQGLPGFEFTSFLLASFVIVLLYYKRS